MGAITGLSYSSISALTEYHCTKISPVRSTLFPTHAKPTCESTSSTYPLLAVGRIRPMDLSTVLSNRVELVAQPPVSLSPNLFSFHLRSLKFVDWVEEEMTPQRPS